MIRRDFLKSAGIAGAAALTEGAAQEARPVTGRKLDLHTHYYPESFFQKIRETPSEFSFDKDPTGRTIIKYRGARFFGVTPPMTDVDKRIEDMDRVGIDVEVVSLSTPNVFFAEAQRQPEIARHGQRRLRRTGGQTSDTIQRLRVNSDGRPRGRDQRASSRDRRVEA